MHYYITLHIFPVIRVIFVLIEVTLVKAEGGFRERLSTGAFEGCLGIDVTFFLECQRYCSRDFLGELNGELLHLLDWLFYSVQILRLLKFTIAASVPDLISCWPISASIHHRFLKYAEHAREKDTRRHFPKKTI